MSYTGRKQKKESDYKKEAHKLLTQKKKVQLGNLWRQMKDKELEASTKEPIKRKPRKAFNITMLLQIIFTLTIFSVFYIYAVKKHPANGFMQLTAFYLLYGFGFSIISGFFFKFLTGKGYNFAIVLYHLFYTIATAIAAFSVIYLPTLLILFAANQTIEWLSLAFIISLVVLPIAYIVSIFLVFAKERSMKPIDYLRYLFDRKRKKEDKIQQRRQVEKLDYFYEKFDSASEKYEQRTSRKLSKEDLISPKDK